MVCCDILYFWIRSEYREYNKRGDDLGRIESQDEIDGEIEQVKKYNLSIENQLMSVCALSEMAVMAFLLFFKTNLDYPINFYKDVCQTDCSELINRMIAVRIIAAMMLFVGARMEVVAFKIPWFIVTISGYAPFWQIITSSFVKYEHLQFHRYHYSSLEKIVSIYGNLTKAMIHQKH